MKWPHKHTNDINTYKIDKNTYRIEDININWNNCCLDIIHKKILCVCIFLITFYSSLHHLWYISIHVHYKHMIKNTFICNDIYTGSTVLYTLDDRCALLTFLPFAMVLLSKSYMYMCTGICMYIWTSLYASRHMYRYERIHKDIYILTFLPFAIVPLGESYMFVCTGICIHILISLYVSR